MSWTWIQFSTEANLITIPLFPAQTSRLETRKRFSTSENQKGNPTENSNDPDGSPSRGFTLRPYSTRNGPMIV